MLEEGKSKGEWNIRTCHKINVTQLKKKILFDLKKNIYLNYFIYTLLIINVYKEGYNFVTFFKGFYNWPSYDEAVFLPPYILMVGQLIKSYVGKYKILFFS